MQAIYGTDKCRGRGIIAATGDVTSDISDTLSRWNTNITSETRSYLRPSPGTTRSDNPEKVYTLVTEQNTIYIMCTVYDNERDSKHRWNTETHGIFLDAKALESPGSFLYFDKNQFDPINAVLTENLDTSSKRTISDREAMQLCGFLNENGSVSEKYIKLMRCVYNVLCENTAVAQTLCIKVNLKEKILPCLQAIYAAMPDSLRSLISSSNVPMTAVSLPFITPEHADNMPSGAKYFDLETGATNVTSDDLNLYFFEKFLERPERIRSVLRIMEKDLREDWSNRTEEHYDFLSYYLLGKEKMNYPSQCSNLEIERIIESLVSINTSSNDINEILYSYIKYCRESEYILKTPRLYNVLRIKRQYLLNESREKSRSLGMLIRDYEAWMLMTTNPDQEIMLLDRAYKSSKNQYQLCDELHFIMQYMPDLEDRVAFADNLAGENLIGSFSSMDNFSEIADYCILCNNIADNFDILMVQMRKVSKNIHNACIQMFDRKAYDNPETLKEYFMNSYCAELNELKIPQVINDNIINEIRQGFWKNLHPDNYRNWIQSPAALDSIYCMIIAEMPETQNIYSRFCNIYQAIKQIPCDDKYAKGVKRLLATYQHDSQSLLAEVLIYESFKSDSAVQQICMHHPDHWNFAFCLDLYSSLNCYHQIPGNIFDLTEENDFAVFNDLMQVNVDTISEKAFDFYIDQLNKKLEVCRDEDCKLYDTVRSKAVSSRNKSVKQNEKMVKAQQRTIECSSSNDDVNENDHSEGFFKQGKKIFENLFKGRK